jgi:hypothetical protein
MKVKLFSISALLVGAAIFTAACGSKGTTSEVVGASDTSPVSSAPKENSAKLDQDFCQVVKTFSKALYYTEGGWGNHMANMESNKSMAGSVKAPFEALQWATKELLRVSPPEYIEGVQRQLDYVDSYVDMLARFDFDLQTIINNATPVELSFLTEWGSNSYFDDETGQTAISPKLVELFRVECVDKLGQDWFEQS